MPVQIIMQQFSGLRIDKQGRPYATLGTFARVVGVFCFAFTAVMLGLLIYYDIYWLSQGRDLMDLTTWLVMGGMFLILCLIGAGLLRWRCWVDDGILYWRKGLLPTKSCPVEELRLSARQTPITISKAMGHYVLPSPKGKVKLHYLFSHGFIALMDYVYKGRESRQPYTENEQVSFHTAPAQWMAM